MCNKFSILLFSTLLIFSQHAFACAPLEKKLGLDTEMSKQVVAIQHSYQAQYKTKRQEYSKESRKLRRARKAYDSNLIAQQEQIIEKLRDELKQIRSNEHKEILQLLPPEKGIKFEEIIQKRRAI